MKKLILAACFTVMAGFAFATDINLKIDGVSSYTRTEYSVTSKFGDYFRSVTGKQVHNFINGIETEVLTHNSKDEVTDRVVYKYDSEFNLSNVIYLDSAGNEMMKVEYEYLDGELKSYSEFNEDGSFTAKTIFKKESNRVEQNDYDAAGKLQSKFITKVNGDELPVEYVVYNGDGSLAQYEKFFYDESKRISMKEVYGPENTIVEKTYYRYDSNGNLSELQLYDGEEKLRQRHVVKNDAYGNPVRISIYDVAEKFGTVVNELVSMSDYSYTR